MGTITGTAGYDALTGTPGADFIYGHGDNDFLAGGAGNDTIFISGRNSERIRNLNNLRLYTSGVRGGIVYSEAPPGVAVPDGRLRDEDDGYNSTNSTNSTPIRISDFAGSHFSVSGRDFGFIQVQTNGNIAFLPTDAEVPDLRFVDISRIGGSATTTTTNGLPVFAPFWADVDTSRAGTVQYYIDPTNHVFSATWNGVGYYRGGTAPLNTFQVHVVDRGNGDADIIFRYSEINWLYGDGQLGTNGQNGVQRPLMGYSVRPSATTGSGQYYSIEPETLAARPLPATVTSDDLKGDYGARIDAAIRRLPTADGNTGEAGVYVFPIRDGRIFSYTAGGTLAGGDGDDSLYGDIGIDTAVFAGTRNSYSITSLSGTDGLYGVSVAATADAVSEAVLAGTDDLCDIEKIRFSGDDRIYNNTKTSLSSISIASLTSVTGGAGGNSVFNAASRIVRDGSTIRLNFIISLSGYTSERTNYSIVFGRGTLPSRAMPVNHFSVARASYSVIGGVGGGRITPAINSTDSNNKSISLAMIAASGVSQIDAEVVLSVHENSREDDINFRYTLVSSNGIVLNAAQTGLITIKSDNPLAEDIADSAETTAVLPAIPSSGSVFYTTNTTLTHANDVDWFRVVLAAGQNYHIENYTLSTADIEDLKAPTIAHPVFFRVKNSAGIDVTSTIAHIWNSNVTNSTQSIANSRGDDDILISPTAAGTYYITVQAQTAAELGAYGIEITRVSDPASTTTTGTTTTGTTTTGGTGSTATASAAPRRSSDEALRVLPVTANTLGAGTFGRGTGAAGVIAAPLLTPDRAGGQLAG